MTFHSIKTYLAKKDKNNLTKRFVHKELRRSDFLITIEEYVGARETPSSTTKNKNIKRHKKT